MSLDHEIKRQIEIICEGCEEVIPMNELKSKLERSMHMGTPLKIKMGIDPTASDVHLGHMVVYKKIRQLQDLGHDAHLIIGDYTARIGDPTGRNIERQSLSEAKVKENCETYTEQIFKIVNPKKTTIHYQSKWFDNVSLSDVLSTTSKFSVAQMLSHDTFKKRIESGERLSLHEMMYPVLQAWDSVEVRADIELGGTDQKFNILCGRDLQKENNQEQQVAIFLPLLMGTDGRKMSKSFNNHIAVLSTPSDKFGKVMSIKDELIPNFFTYATNYSLNQVNVIKERLKSENPRDIKLLLAKEIITIYHGEDEALKAEEEFLNIFSKKGLPDEIPQMALEPGMYCILKLLKDSSLTKSISEGKRLITQGGLKVNNQKINDIEYLINIEKENEHIIKAGKRRFLKVICNV